MRIDFYSRRPNADPCDTCEHEERCIDLFPCRYCLNLPRSRAIPNCVKSLDLDNDAILQYIRAQDKETLARWEYSGFGDNEKEDIREIMHGTD